LLPYTWVGSQINALKNIIEERKETNMKTHWMKLALILTIAVMFLTVPSAWCGELQPNMMGGGGMWWWHTTTIPGGGGGATTTIPGGGGYPGGGFGGGGMMGGGGSMMNQLRIADLTVPGDNVPETVIISGGTYLVILNNDGTILVSKPLPLIPGQTYQTAVAGGLDIADIDDDGIPEIVTTYSIRNYGMWYGGQTTYGTYLVILDNQGNYKDSKKLQ
jgi:hypothetical protein